MWRLWLFRRGFHPPHRHGGQKALPELLLLLVSLQQQAIEAWRVYRAGTDGVDADPALLQINRPGASERAHGRLGCVVDTKPSNPLGCGHRGIQNDGTAATVAPTLKQRKRLLHGEQKPFGVDAECFVKVGFRRFPPVLPIPQCRRWRTGCPCGPSSPSQWHTACQGPQGLRRPPGHR